MQAWRATHLQCYPSIRLILAPQSVPPRQRVQVAHVAVSHLIYTALPSLQLTPHALAGLEPTILRHCSCIIYSCVTWPSMSLCRVRTSLPLNSSPSLSLPPPIPPSPSNPAGRSPRVGEDSGGRHAQGLGVRPARHPARGGPRVWLPPRPDQQG